MAVTLSYDSAPDLKLLFARAVLGSRSGGRELPEVTAYRGGVGVDVDRLVDYERVCGFGVSPTLPLTYPHVLAFPLQVAIMSRRDFPLPLIGLVHLENVMTWSRPIALDETLDVTVHGTGLREHRKGRLVDLVSEVSASGEAVWHGVSTYLSRGPGDPSAVTPPAPNVDELLASAGGVTWRIGAGDGRRYAGVSGDVNPIHLHPLTARAFGFRSAIAHGMYTYARALAALAPRVPESGTSSVWFHKPVPLPSLVELKVSQDARLAVLVPANGEGDHLVVQHAPS